GRCTEAHEGALGAAADRACDVREARRARSAGQDEFLQRRQIRVEAIDGVLEAQDVCVADSVVTGNRQLTAKVEQIVLDFDQARGDIRGQRFREQYAEHRIQLVDGA